MRLMRNQTRSTLRLSSRLTLASAITALAAFTALGVLGGCSTNSKPPQEKTRDKAAVATKVATPSTPQGGTYDTASPTREAASTPGGSAETSVGLTYTVPASWTKTPSSSGMRAAQFALPAAGGEPAEMVLFFFGAGQGGDVQANLDRWIGQMKQPDGGDARSHAQVATRTVGPYKLTILSVDGTYDPGAMMGGPAPTPKTGHRMWCSVVEGPGGPWFWKATGPKKTLDGEAANLDALVASFRPAP